MGLPFTVLLRDVYGTSINLLACASVDQLAVYCCRLETEFSSGPLRFCVKTAWASTIKIPLPTIEMTVAIGEDRRTANIEAMYSNISSCGAEKRRPPISMASPYDFRKCNAPHRKPATSNSFQWVKIEEVVMMTKMAE